VVNKSRHTPVPSFHLIKLLDSVPHLVILHFNQFLYSAPCSVADPEDRARGNEGVVGTVSAARVQGKEPPLKLEQKCMCNGKSVFVNTKMQKSAHNVQPYES